MVLTFPMVGSDRFHYKCFSCYSHLKRSHLPFCLPTDSVRYANYTWETVDQYRKTSRSSVCRRMHICVYVTPEAEFILASRMTAMLTSVVRLRPPAPAVLRPTPRGQMGQLEGRGLLPKVCF